MAPWGLPLTPQRGMLLFAAAVSVLLSACETGQAPPTRLVLASTTSTEDSGLFGVLIPAFERAHPGYRVEVIAVGTGQALELGRRKDADVLLVHAPAAESAFVADGHATERREVMYNDFVVVGPPDDPAGIRGTADVVAALRKLAATLSPFVSRGDDSGTHRAELAFWKEAALRPGGAWYVDAGQGMGDVLMLASEKGAYTLTDRGTFLAMKASLRLEILTQGDRRLFNQYGVVPVTGAQNAAGARAFAEWITSEDAQRLIGSFGRERFGEPLFVPNANRLDDF